MRTCHSPECSVYVQLFLKRILTRSWKTLCSADGGRCSAGLASFRSSGDFGGADARGCAHLKGSLQGGPSPAAAGREAAETTLSAPAAWTGPRAGWRSAGREEEEEEEHHVKQKGKKLFKENVFILGYESETRSSACSPGSVYIQIFLTLLMRLSLMCRSCCCASCMCRRFWSTSPFPSMALCKANR